MLEGIRLAGAGAGGASGNELRPGLYFSINDHLGTLQRLITGEGTTVWQAAALPFGRTQVQLGTVRNNLRFPGQHYDADTGLHYNWNRYYDPETRRYLSPTPSDSMVDSTSMPMWKMIR